MHAFKVGDLVRHITGVTKMAVAAVLEQTGHLRCEWQDRDGTPHSETYPPECLQLWSDYENEITAKRERADDKPATGKAARWVRGADGR
jgi:uncharacterized protein YodC (DUF2158 family)